MLTVGMADFRRLYPCDREPIDFIFLLMENGGFQMSFRPLWILRGIYSITSRLQSFTTTTSLNTLDPHQYRVPLPDLAWTLMFVGPEPEVQKDVWTRTIPSYLSRIPESLGYNNDRYSSRYSSTDDDVIPPALPRQLEKPFLNQNHIQKDDQSVLPQPAHVRRSICTTYC